MFTTYLNFGHLRRGVPVLRALLRGQDRVHADIRRVGDEGQRPAGGARAGHACHVESWRRRVDGIRRPTGPVYEAPQGIYVSVHPKTYADAERIVNELSAGGNVEMPFQKTFWSPGFGMTRDRFGIPWMVNCDQQSS
jgi:hypothetical protein